MTNILRPFGRRIFFYTFRLITKPLVWAAASYKIYGVGRKFGRWAADEEWMGINYFFGFRVKMGVESLFFYKEKKNISQNHKDSP